MEKPLERYGYNVVGPGWKHLLETLDSHFVVAVENAIANATVAKPEYRDVKNTPQARVEILQVKEKFGTLRVYFKTHGMSSYLSDFLFGAASYAEAMSCLTCEKCGSREGTETCRKQGEDYSLLLTLCSECRSERDHLPKSMRFNVMVEE